jgi:hypothetical protein
MSAGRRSCRPAAAFAAALLLLAAPCAAPAQRAPRGARLIVQADLPCPVDSSEEIVVCRRAALTPQAQRTLHNVARCMVGHWPRDARNLLLAELRGSDYQRPVRRFIARHPGCTPRRTLRFGGLLLAGALAETLLRTVRDLPTRVAYRPSRPPVQVTNDPDLMSVCAVRGEPAGAAALLRSTPGSDDEAAAVRALQPRLADCLRVGVTARFNRPALRALLALSAYRLAAHNMALASIEKRRLYGTAMS